VWFAVHVFLAQDAVGNPHELQNPRCIRCDAS
jgi:sulfur relay (sulfurtransferase) complex TusBCD TusD component (DsrE family)